MNCLGRPDCIRVPDPPAVISTYLCIARGLNDQHGIAIGKETILFLYCNFIGFHQPVKAETIIIRVDCGRCKFEIIELATLNSKGG